MEDIVLICDDKYALPTLVCVKSIMNGVCTEINLNIHICTFGLSKENIKLFNGLERKNISIFIHIMDKNILGNRVYCIKQKTHVTTTALIKLELANYFANLDKILYLDSDIIIKGDLNELLTIDISDFYLAAVFDYWVHYNNLRYNFKKARREDFYFNSGVMLLNLKKMREDGVSSKLWEYKLNDVKTKLMDQECFNEVCHDFVLPISIKWNFNPEFWGKEHIDQINKIYQENYKNCNDLINDVKIIHYVGKEDKPWVYKTARLREYWDQNYNEIENKPKLSLIVNEIKKRNLFVSSIEKIKEHGFIGYIQFLIYKIKRIRRKEN